MTKIGVFDSGVGGKSVVDEIAKEFPEAEIIYKTHKANLPYGNKTPDQLLDLVKPFLDEFTAECVDVLVIACNTVSTTIQKQIRSYVNFPVVAIVPMIKTAVELTESKVITTCATPTTLASERYAELKAEFAEGIKVLEPDCSDWAQLIESDELADDRLQEVIDQAQAEGADVILLACTHYHWILDRLVKLAGDNIKVIYPTEPIIRHLKTVLAQLE